MGVPAQTFPQRPGPGTTWPWLRSQRWDLTFVLGSCTLVAAPLLAYHLLGVSTSAINIVVAALVGGPHMYSTYTLTALEPHFRRRYPLYTLGALVVPLAVITLAIANLTLLLTAFLFWASRHVLQQVAWIAGCYRARGRVSMAGWSRAADYAVLFTSLYPIATGKLVGGTFVVENRALPIPEPLKAQWFVALAWAAFGVALAIWLTKTVQEVRQGRLNGPKTLLIGLTVGLAFVIPAFDNLDVAFQGMNSWHSFQYLALIWYVNWLRAERGEISADLVRRIAGPGTGQRYYGTLVGVTLAAGALVALLSGTTGLSFEQCYFMVVLSFLLVHYYFDTFLFTRVRVAPGG